MSKESGARHVRRADAMRNRESIVHSAIACLAVDPQATMADIAAYAGLGRVTLYGHFESRPSLIDAVAVEMIRRADEALDALDITGDPRHALTELIRRSWQLTSQSHLVIAAIESDLAPERMRVLHGGLAHRVEILIRRGKDMKVFRQDMPTSWLIAVVHQILHGAAAELSSKRLDPETASDLIITTVLSVLDPPTRAARAARQRHNCPSSTPVNGDPD